MRPILLTQTIWGKELINPNAHSDPGQPIPCEIMVQGGGDAGNEKSVLGGICILIVVHIGLNQPGEQ